MRAINQPQINFNDVWQACIGSISSNSLVEKFKVAENQVLMAIQDYTHKAPNAEWFLINSFGGTDANIVTGTVTKKEFKGLYSYHMVPAKKPARFYYDQLKFSAPFNICPFCGFGHVSTLDHYLPKAKFPILSILPINLVPSCSDCNKNKNSSNATSKRQQCIHPYFDHAPFINEQWLVAEISETVPANIRYLVEPPDNWNDDDKERVKTHFENFQLARRFAVQAGTELPILKSELEFDFGISQDVGVLQALERKVIAAKNQHVNSWKTAMYQALAQSTWYCRGGFKES